MRVTGGARPRKRKFAVSEPLARISVDGKYVANGCGWPSSVSPVTVAATPETSLKTIAVCQLAPWASGKSLGQTVLGAVTRIVDAVVARVTDSRTDPPPLLNVESPEYSAK